LYDPFHRGRFSVGVRTLEAHDSARRAGIMCEIWYPAGASHFGQDYVQHILDTYSIQGEARTQEAIRDAAPAAGPFPLVVYSHPTSRWKRHTATFLCTHLASHGYVVAAPDHGSDDIEKHRVADLSFLIDLVLAGGLGTDIRVEPARIAAVGHSLGGWTVLCAMESEGRIRALVAMAPAGSAKPRSGIVAGKLTFKWKREAPVLYLVAENDVMTPPEGIAEMFKRTPAPKRSIILRQADHHHFVDAVEREHEMVRTTVWPEELKWIGEAMRPAGELCSGVASHKFACALTLAHLDAHLRWKDEARKWLAGSARAKLAEHGIDAYEGGRSERT